MSWLYDKMVETSPAWLLHDIQTFVHWTIPLLFFLHVAVAVVNQIQQETPVQKAFTRWVWCHAALFGVFWLSFSLRQSLLWAVMEIVVYSASVVFGAWLGYRLFRRYLVDIPAGPADNTPS